jgi:hypothetical protein
MHQRHNKFTVTQRLYCTFCGLHNSGLYEIKDLQGNFDVACLTCVGEVLEEQQEEEDQLK